MLHASSRETRLETQRILATETVRTIGGEIETQPILGDVRREIIVRGIHNGAQVGPAFQTNRSTSVPPSNALTTDRSQRAVENFAKLLSFISFLLYAHVFLASRDSLPLVVDACAHEQRTAAQLPELQSLIWGL